MRGLRTVWLLFLKFTFTYNFYCRIRFELHYLKKEGFIRKTKDISNYKAISKLLIVVPSQYLHHWEPGQGNFFYEIYQSAREKYPNMVIGTFEVNANERDWKTRLKSKMIREDPDCILIYSETDPDESGNWTWSEFFLAIKEQWSGKSVLIMFDSVYAIHRWRTSRIARITGNATIVAIDRRIRAKQKKNIRNIGPIFLPISLKSINLLEKQILAKVKNEHLSEVDISFIGKMYPYRKSVFDELEQRKVAVVLNPQKNYLEPDSYLSYVTALHLSKFTINLSRAGGVKVKQLKCRVLETAIFGNALITDERKLGGRFFTRDLDFIHVNRMHRLSEASLKLKYLSFARNRRNRAYQYATFKFLD
jgi:hypothetical protein